MTNINETRLLAWENYKKGSAYANVKKALGKEEYVENSLYSIWIAGYETSALSEENAISADDLRTVIAGLDGRDRRGHVSPTPEARERLRLLAIRVKIPHGGIDTPDQCRMILQALVDDEIVDRFF